MWMVNRRGLGWTFPLLNTAPWVESYACILHFVAFTEIVYFITEVPRSVPKKICRQVRFYITWLAVTANLNSNSAARSIQQSRETTDYSSARLSVE